MLHKYLAVTVFIALISLLSTFAINSILQHVAMVIGLENQITLTNPRHSLLTNFFPDV